MVYKGQLMTDNQAINNFWNTVGAQQQAVGQARSVPKRDINYDNGYAEEKKSTTPYPYNHEEYIKQHSKQRY